MGGGGIRIDTPFGSAEAHVPAAPGPMSVKLDNPALANAANLFLGQLSPEARTMVSVIATFTSPVETHPFPGASVSGSPAQVLVVLDQVIARLPPEARDHPLLRQASQQIAEAKANGASTVTLIIPLPSHVSRQQIPLQSGAQRSDDKRIIEQPKEEATRGAGIRNQLPVSDQHTTRVDQPVQLPPARAEEPQVRAQHQLYLEAREGLVQTLRSLPTEPGVAASTQRLPHASPNGGSPTQGGKTGTGVAAGLERLMGLLGGLDNSTRELLDKRTMLRESVFQRAAFNAMMANGTDGSTALRLLHEAFGGKLAISADLLAKIAAQQAQIQSTKQGRLPEEMLLQQHRSEGAKGKQSKPQLGYRRIERLGDESSPDEEQEDQRAEDPPESDGETK